MTTVTSSNKSFLHRRHNVPAKCLVISVKVEAARLLTSLRLLRGLEIKVDAATGNAREMTYVHNCTVSCSDLLSCTCGVNCSN